MLLLPYPLPYREKLRPDLGGIETGFTQEVCHRVPYTREKLRPDLGGIETT